MINKSPLTCFQSHIGVPFQYGGRGPEAFDCWGLVKDCYFQWHGVELPDYRSTNSPEINADLMAQESARLWRKLSEPEPGSVLMMRVNRFGAHVGFMHSQTRFLQALENLGVIESRFDRFKRQIIGAYVYAGQDRS